MKFNRHTLKKLEQILEELEYDLIYEKGSFTSGYCIVEDKNVVVINKFFDPEARINCIIEVLDTIQYSRESLSTDSRKYLDKLLHEESELPIIEGHSEIKNL